MKILAAHNFYQQPGGEDIAYQTEVALLEQQGNTVVRYEQQNSRIRSGLTTGFTATWNNRSYQALKQLGRQHRPAIAHFYNTFPLISPAAYYAIGGQGTAVVQKLANFRLICPGSFLMREGNICEECIQQKSFMPALRHRCYRGSFMATASVATMLAVHEKAQTWHHAVDLYISPTEFVRNKFIEAGFPADRVVVKPHMLLPDPGVGNHERNQALFVGRLSPEKGVDVLADAWKYLADLQLKIAGDGPLARREWPQGIHALGYQNREQMYAHMKSAQVLLVPSVNYEIGPLTVLEAFACGTPVIASNLGSMAERIRDGHNGLLFRPGDAQDLAAKVRYAFTHPEHMAQMRVNARREYEEKYTPERNYRLLMAIYEQAMENAKRRKRKAS